MINAVYNVAHFVKSVSFCGRIFVCVCVCMYELMFSGKSLVDERICNLFVK